MMSDSNVAAHVASLREERRGYELRARVADEVGDDVARGEMEKRIALVDEAIAHWSGERVERRPAGRGKQTRVKAVD